jgi:hypothetical protein
MLLIPVGYFCVKPHGHLYSPTVVWVDGGLGFSPAHKHRQRERESESERARETGHRKVGVTGEKKGRKMQFRGDNS